MIKIPLTKDQIAIVDDCDEHLLKWKWYAEYSPNSKSFYALKMWHEKGKRGTVRLHQVILGRPIDKKMKIDHINGDTLDNRRQNLRFVSNRQNISNSRRRRAKQTTSKYPGVYWSKTHKKWHTHTFMNGRVKFIGRFKSEEKAFQAREEFLKKIAAQPPSAILG